MSSSPLFRTDFQLQLLLRVTPYTSHLTYPLRDWPPLVQNFKKKRQKEKKKNLSKSLLEHYMYDECALTDDEHAPGLTDEFYQHGLRGRKEASRKHDVN